MNRYHSIIPLAPIIGIVITTAFVSHPVLALENSETVKAKLKEFTVQISGADNGTGTIIERNNNTYTVLTCRHVVETEGNYNIVTIDGKTHQVIEIEAVPNVDLAIVKFKSNINYHITELGDSNNLIEGTSIYVVGYPLHSLFFEERSYRFYQSIIVGKSTKEEEGYDIAHDSPFSPGGSGGGMFDTNGRLIGVNGKTLTGDLVTNKAHGKGIPLAIYLETRSDLTAITNLEIAQDITSIGVQNFKQKDYCSAIGELDRALKVDGNNLEAYYYRGAAFFAVKDYRAAIQDFSRLLQLNPNNPFVYSYRGEVRAAKEDYQGAITDYNRAIQLNPDFYLPYINRGFVYAKLGKTQNALDDYTQAIKLNSESATAYYNRGLVFGRDLEDLERALADFSKAIEIEPQDAQVYTERGTVYTLQEKFQLAINDYIKAIKIDSQYAEAYYGLGIAYFQDNQREKALKSLQQASDIFYRKGDTTNYKRALDKIGAIRGY